MRFRVYETLVTMLHGDDAAQEIFVTSSMQGRRADWYRNLQVGSPVDVQIGKERFRATQRFLDEEECRELYQAVCESKPIDNGWAYS